MAPFLLIGAVMLGQIALGGVVASPWFLPDVSLALLVVMIAQLRTRRAAVAVFAAGVAALFSARHPAWIAGAYLAVAAFVWMLGSMWDLTKPSLQRVAVGMAEALWLLACLAIDQGSGTLAWMALRTGLTVVCLPLVQPLSRFIAHA